MVAQLKVLWLCSFVLICLGSHRAEAEGRPSYGQSVTGSLLEEPRNLDPVSVRTHTDMFLVSMIFDTLYRVENKRTRAHLAYAMPDASDPLHVRVPLRPGVLFNNGRKLRAEDILQSLQRLQKSSSYHYMGSVSSMEVSIREPEGIEEIIFHLRAPDPQLARRLSNVHTAICEKGKIPTWSRAVGTGPFSIQERSFGRREVTMKAFDRHFAGRSYVDEVKLRWYNDASSEARKYETGGSQLSSRGSIAFAGHKPKFRTQKLQAGAWILSYLGFGRAHSINKESEFRGAVSAAIGRKGMSRIGSGELTVPSDSPLPSALLRTASGNVGVVADKRKTARLLASLNSRFPELDAGTLSLELIVNSSRPDDALIGARVAAALFAFGIRTRIVSLSASAFFRRVRNGKYDIRVGQFSVSSPFASDIWRASFSLAGKKAIGNNRSALERHFHRELPIIPLFHRGLRVHHRSDLFGLSFAPLSITHRGTRLMYENLFLFGSPEKN